ncbi:hypothetical protein HDU76_013672 [Blyttiomyces sp. JEL0837]|nr:hypothetical protein HDU76_013672 [Blyttiomyces sp. JEL0837]
MNKDIINKLDTILNDPSILSTTFLNDIYLLGVHFQAACIGNLGIERSVKLFLGEHYSCEESPYQLKHLNMPMHSEWFDQTMPNAQHFANALSIAALSGDVDLEVCDFTALFFLTAIGDLDTLVKLESKKLLPVKSHHRILCEAIFHDQDEVALWVLPLKIVDPSIDNNKALFAAIENGRKAVVQELVNDQRVVATVDWNAAIVAVIYSTWGNDMDLLNLVYRPDPAVNPFDVEMNFYDWYYEPEYVKLASVLINPYKWNADSQSVFELLACDLDYSSTQLTDRRKNLLFQSAISAASMKTVIKFVEFGWLQVFKPVSQLLRVAAVFERWEILDYLLGFSEFDVPEPEYLSLYRDDLSLVIKLAAEHDKLGVIKTMVGIVTGHNKGLDFDDEKHFFFGDIMNDGLRVAAHHGNLKVIDYILNCEDIDIKYLGYQCYVTCVSENRPESLHAILASKRQIDGPYEQKLFKGHWKETVPSDDMPFFDCLLYEACSLRRLSILKVLVDSGRCNVASNDGFAFRIAAGILEEEWVSSNGYLCSFSETEGSFTESEGESFDSDEEEDWIDEGDGDGIGDSCQHLADEEGCGGNGMESNSYALYRYEYNDRREVCKYLLEHDAIVQGMSTKVLEASVSLPASLFNSVVTRGGFTQDQLTSIASIPETFKTATLANQLDTLEILLTTREKFSCKVLLSGLTTAVECGLESFFHAMVNKLSDETDLDEENADEWSKVMDSAIKHNWCTGRVVEICRKVSRDAKVAQVALFANFHENGLNYVVKA